MGWSEGMGVRGCASVVYNRVLAPETLCATDLTGGSAQGVT